ncbi:MAG TPA: methylated-DNA--[protein]-cysteine S-methyltransferase [Nitrospirales bacterium]
MLPKQTRREAEREIREAGPGDGISSNGTGNAAALHLKAARAVLEAYLNGEVGQVHLPLDLEGQPRFRRKVWEVLQTIPYGRVRSYGWVARKIGKPQAARAVGGACGANPVPLLVPCHRVIAGDGSLGGFSGGLGVKKRLLRLEGAL